MAASRWGYLAPYQADYSAALRTLRKKVLADGDYDWPHEHIPRPATVDEIGKIRDASVWENGFHSILDVFRVVPEDADPDDRWGAVRPVTADELDPVRMTDPTVWRPSGLDGLADGPCQARVAVIHDEAGTPTHLYFFGYSGG